MFIISDDIFDLNHTTLLHKRNLSRIRGSASRRFRSAFSLPVPLETSNTLFQDAFALLLLIIFAEIPFHRWNSAPEHHRISLDNIFMWKQYLRVPGAQSFITSEELETSCGVVPSLLEEREASAEEGCGVPVIVSYKGNEDLREENGACHGYNLPTQVLILAPFSSFSGDLGTQYHYI